MERNRKILPGNRFFRGLIRFFISILCLMTASVVSAVIDRLIMNALPYNFVPTSTALIFMFVVMPFGILIGIASLLPAWLYYEPGDAEKAAELPQMSPEETAHRANTAKIAKIMGGLTLLIFMPTFFLEFRSLAYNVLCVIGAVLLATTAVLAMPCGCDAHSGKALRKDQEAH